MVELLHIDCMEYMKGLPDKAFDLAVVDPPYGLSLCLNGKNSKEWGISKDKGFTFKNKNYDKKEWDNEKPNNKYFSELKRVSKKQIIWGGNFYPQLDMKNYLVWYKTALSNNDKYSDTELAYLSFNAVPKLIDIWWNGFGSINSGEARIHPTQKPIALYKWLLQNYAKPGDKILDTHLGSGSSAIAAEKMGFDFVGCEIDKDYYDAAVKRFNKETDKGLFKDQNINGFYKPLRLFP